jgi:hypothetical protein
MSNPQYLAQIGHFFGACTVILIAALFSVGLVPILWTLGIGLVLAALKEFVFDTASWGEGDSWSDSVMDFAFYALGGLVGLGLAALHLYLH